MLPLRSPERRLDKRTAYFAALADSYAAATSAGERVLELAIGEWQLEARFASRELELTLAPAVERLVVSSDGRDPQLTLHLWDTASTGVRVPLFPWSPQDIGPGGLVIGYDDNCMRSLYRDDGPGSFSLAMFDMHRAIGYVWFNDHERINWYERAEPLRAPIHWWLTTDSRFLVHASAVGDERGAVLLTGGAGAGKTTTTLASLEAGLRFVGDNYVLVSVERELEVYGLYGTAKLWPQTLEQLAGLEPHVRTFEVGAEEKLVVDVMRYRPDSLTPRLPLRAVVVPEVSARSRARITRCSSVDALLALAPSSMLQLPRVERGLDGMSALVRRLPTYRLELGRDVMSAPAALSALLEELGDGDE